MGFTWQQRKVLRSRTGGAPSVIDNIHAVVDRITLTMVHNTPDIKFVSRGVINHIKKNIVDEVVQYTGLRDSVFQKLGMRITNVTWQRNEDWRDLVTEIVNSTNIREVGMLDKRFGERYSGEEETLKKKIIDRIRPRIDFYVEKGYDRNLIEERIANERGLKEYAEYVLGRPMKYDSFKKFVRKLIDEELEEEPRDKKKRRFGGTGRSFMKDASGNFVLDSRGRRIKTGGRKGREAVEQMLEDEERAERQREQEEINRGPLRPNTGFGRLFVIIENNTKRDASGIELFVNGQQRRNVSIGTVRKGKTRRYLTASPLDVESIVELSCETHDVDPGSQHVTVKGKRHGGILQEAGSGNVVFKLLKPEKKEKGKAGKIAGEKISGMVKGRKDYHTGIFSSIFMLIVGFMLSAILGQMWFVFAFLAFAVHLLIPPQTGENIKEKIENIRDAYERRIDEAEKSGRDKEEIDSLYDRMKKRIEVENIIGKFSFSKVFNAGMHKTYYGRGFLREFFKALGFLFLMIAFVWSPVPLAPVIGIIIGFAGYFMLGGSDYHKKKDEGEK